MICLTMNDMFLLAQVNVQHYGVSCQQLRDPDWVVEFGERISHLLDLPRRFLQIIHNLDVSYVLHYGTKYTRDDGSIDDQSFLVFLELINPEDLERVKNSWDGTINPVSFRLYEIV